jgi:hypothetical protein
MVAVLVVVVVVVVKYLRMIKCYILYMFVYMYM